MLALLKDETMEKDIALLDAGKEMAEVDEEFEALLLVDNATSHARLKMLLPMKRRMMKYDSKRDHVVVGCPKLMKKFEALYEKCQKRCKSEQDVGEKKRSELVDAYKALSDVAGGHKRGQD